MGVKKRFHFFSEILLLKNISVTDVKCPEKMFSAPRPPNLGGDFAPVRYLLQKSRIFVILLHSCNRFTA